MERIEACRVRLNEDLPYKLKEKLNRLNKRARIFRIDGLHYDSLIAYVAQDGIYVYKAKEYTEGDNGLNYLSVVLNKFTSFKEFKEYTIMNRCGADIKYIDSVLDKINKIYKH